MNNLITLLDRVNLWNPLNSFDQFLENDPESVHFRTNHELNFIPNCDIEETDEDYLIWLDLPGISKNDLNIEMTENTITVSGERHQKCDKKRIVNQERHCGKFKRNFRLPLTVNSERIEAEHQDGVLKITIPKAEILKPRQIDIK